MVVNVVDAHSVRMVAQDVGTRKFYSVYLPSGESYYGGSAAEALSAARYLIRLRLENVEMMNERAALRDAERTKRIARHRAKQLRRSGGGG